MAQELTTLAAVKAFLQRPATDPAGQDAIIGSLITRASALIHRYSEREFVVYPGLGATRVFEMPPQPGAVAWLDMAPYDAQSISSVSIDSDQPNPVLLSAAEWRPHPIPATDGVFKALKLQPLAINIGRIPWPDRQVSVTGTWGFPSVPAEVEHACIVTVSIWLRRDVSAFSASMNLDEQRVERPHALPSAAKATLDGYKRHGLG